MIPSPVLITCRDRRSTAARSRSRSDNRTGLSFIALAPLRYSTTRKNKHLRYRHANNPIRCYYLKARPLVKYDDKRAICIFGLNVAISQQTSVPILIPVGVGALDDPKKTFMITLSQRINIQFIPVGERLGAPEKNTHGDTTSTNNVFT